MILIFNLKLKTDDITRDVGRQNSDLTEMVLAPLSMNGYPICGFDMKADIHSFQNMLSKLTNSNDFDF